MTNYSRKAQSASLEFDGFCCTVWCRFSHVDHSKPSTHACYFNTSNLRSVMASWKGFFFTNVRLSFYSLFTGIFTTQQVTITKPWFAFLIPVCIMSPSFWRAVFKNVKILTLLIMDLIYCMAGNRIENLCWRIESVIWCCALRWTDVFI